MITTHVLDTSIGQPAAGVTVLLEMRLSSEWSPIGRGTTDEHGRLSRLIEGRTMTPGTYCLTFDTGTYHRAQGIASPFFPEVKIFFNVDGAGGHFHLPLLLSPYGYSTYRGS